MRICRLIVAVLTVALIATTTNASAQGPSSSAVIPGYSWLQISAFTSIPLAGADVAVYDTRGNVLFQQDAATNDQGAFAAHIDNLPRDFRVTIAFDGNAQQDPGLASLGTFTLSAEARNFDPEYGVVYVDPVTTLADMVMERLSQHDLETAKAMVRRFLVLPRNAGLGDALRQGSYYQSPYFSEKAFIAQAKQQGGMEPFLNELAPLILKPSSPAHSFAGAPAATVRNPLGFIAVNLAAGAIQYLAGQGVGWVMSYGSKPAPPGATKEDIEHVQTALADLQSSVDGLSDQLAALTELLEAKFTETQLHIITVNALPLAAKVNGVERNVSFYAQRCPPILETDNVSNSEPVDPYCTERRVTIESQLRDVTIDHSFDTLASYLLDKKALGSRGMIHLYSQSLGQTVRFFRPADSTKIQDMFEYWKSVQTQAANLNVELFHVDGVQNAPPQHNELLEFLGNAHADPPTQGRFQNTLAAEQKLVFPSVPVGTVINTKDKAMWLTSFPVNRQYLQDCGGPPPAHNIWNYPVTEPVKINGLEWLSPTLEETKALIDGWTGSSPNQWLIDQTRAVTPDTPTSAGFADVTYYRPYCDPTSKNSYPAMWTRDFLGTTNIQGTSYKEYAALDLKNGKFATSDNGWRVAGWSIYDWLFLDRELKSGEQYYWYPNQ